MTSNTEEIRGKWYVVGHIINKMSKKKCLQIFWDIPMTSGISPWSRHPRVLPILAAPFLDVQKDVTDLVPALLYVAVRQGREDAVATGAGEDLVVAAGRLETEHHLGTTNAGLEQVM